MISVAPLVATAGYVAVVVGTCYISAKLSVAIDVIKELIVAEEEDRRDQEMKAKEDSTLAAIATAMAVESFASEQFSPDAWTFDGRSVAGSAN